MALCCACADDQLPLLNELIARGELVGLAMEQLEILKANLEVSAGHAPCAWARAVVAARGSPAGMAVCCCCRSHTLPCLLQALEWGQNVRKLLALLPPLSSEPAAPAAAAAQPGPTRQAAEAALVEGVGASGAQPQGAGEAGHQGAAPQQQREQHLPPFDQRPQLQVAAALLEEGSILPCDNALFDRLRK